MKKMFIGMLLGMLLLAVPAGAKQGFYAGGSLMNDTMLNSDLNTLDSGVGLDVRFGYNFGSFSLEGNIMGSGHDEKRAGYGKVSFGGLSIDFRIPLTAQDNPNQVYILAGLGGYSLKGFDPVAAADVKYTGGGYDLGAGLEHYFNEHLAFDLAAVYRAIKYDKKEVRGDTTKLDPRINGDMLSVEAGLNYHF